MEAIKKKRTVQYNGLKRLKEQLKPLMEKKETSFETKIKLEAFQKKLSSDAEAFYAATDDVLVKLKDEETEEASKCYSDKDDIIQLVVDVEAKIAAIQAFLDKENSERSIVSEDSSSSSSGIRYATIMKEVEPPEFDGDPTKFAEWRAMFENLVHDNKDYTSTSKLFFLKKCFVGEAKDVISHYPITREGYSNAWKYVIGRFGKPKAVVGAFFKKLMSLEPIKHEGGIQKLLDATNSIIRGLSAAEEEVNDTMSRFISYLTYIKLDEVTRRDWDNHYTNMTEYPKFEEINKFLQSRAHVASERIVKKENKKSFVTVSSENNKKSKCQECNGNHALYVCDVFKKREPRDRFRFAKSKSLCIICLRGGHSANDCQHHNFKCRCGLAHNYMLHFGSSNNKKSEEPIENKSSENSDFSVKLKETIQKSAYSCSVENIEKTVLLPSALVKIICGDIVGKMRVLLDSCSQATLISDDAVKRLKLPPQKCAVASSISGVGTSSTTTSSIVDLIVASRKDTFRLGVRADVVPAASLKYSANVQFPKKIIDSLRNIPLADPIYLDSNISINKIDMIIGAEYFGKCILDQSLSIDSLDLRLSQFGWIVSGVVPQLASTEKFVGFTRQSVDEKLSKFWEIEEVGTVKLKSQESDPCIRHFEETYSIMEDGKFMVRLPFRIDRDSVANNRARALNALTRSEKNLNENHRKEYHKFMREYINLGHMSIVEHDPTACFLPHRAVIRQCSSTTPLRVVFNASAGNPSLNDALWSANTLLQRELFDILISMRFYTYIFTADVEKMYRMIWVHPDDRKFQSIFWRDQENATIEEYQLNTVTYGLGPASFIATKCLDVIATEVENKITEAESQKFNKIIADVIRNNFYMDDGIAGANSAAEAAIIQKQLHAVLKEHGFLLRKYSSNCPEVLENIEPELRTDKSAKAMTNNLGSVAILGIDWEPSDDLFTIKVNTDQCGDSDVTKRIILSFISRTFDPLGLVSPVLVRGKLLLQNVWLEGKDWDDLVSVETAQLFKSYIDDLLVLNTIKIPRYIFGAFQCEIIGFCDASSSAYCAAVYIRAKNEKNKILCRLVSSRTRVAPLKQLTVPKLELQSCKLLADLVSRVANNLKISQEKIFAFSDSTVALCWLSKPPDQWKTFVSNRVQSITNVIPFKQWAYVKGCDNPADDGTRGLEVAEFVKKSRWFDGPEFLYAENYRTYHSIPNITTHQALERRKVKIVLNAVIIVDFTLRFSSYLRLIRAVAFILRVKSFGENIKKDDSNTLAISDKKSLKTINEVHPLSIEEIERSFKITIRFVQSISFGAEVERLKNNRPIKRRSALASLNPYLDEDGILRVGGRLSKASLSDQVKHPIILSSKCHFAKLYCRYIHLKYFHARRSLVASFIAAKFWLVGGATNLIKYILRSCVACARIRAVTAQQIMGQLPKERITVSPAFTFVGVDFAGPFKCKCTDHRTTRYYQIYAAVFVCLITRAVYIEIVSGLSTEKFLMAFQTFVSRRGKPSIVFSDNATNFVGTKNVLQLNENELQDYASSENIRWKFIPPASPHHGGVWEAAVKSFKYHLYAVTQGNVLNFEEYRTLFSKVEAVMNMRPLCYKSPVEQGSEIITPGHFLVGKNLMAIPAIDSEKISLSRRLLLIQNITKGFWAVWSKDYLNQLQQRSRWKTSLPNLTVGQVVAVKNAAGKPFQWPLGLITKVYPDSEGLVRVVDVKFQGQIKNRSIANLIILPIDEGLNQLLANL